jgi:hypothetical protein
MRAPVSATLRRFRFAPMRDLAMALLHAQPHRGLRTGSLICFR